MMQSVGRRYVRYINNNYHRSGTLWEGRYKASLVDSDRYILTCYRYIELNPVRALMVDEPADYRWSSHLHNINQKVDPLITHHPAYSGLANNSITRSRHYQLLFNNDIDRTELETIRATLNKNQVFADTTFILDLEKKLNRRVREGFPGRPRKNLL